MRKKSLLLLFAIGTVSAANCQNVYEDFVYPNANSGTIELKDVLISEINDTADVISTGYYIFDEDDVTSVYDRAVITSHNSNGTSNFSYSYGAVDKFSKSYNVRCNSIAELNPGYITVGFLADSPTYGTTVPGGGDIFILKCDASGTVVSSKRIDLGGNEVAHSIVARDATNTKFIICGESGKSDGTKDVFVMEIDDFLNIGWVSEYDLKITFDKATIATLYDVTMDSTAIWAVGTIQDTGTVTTDGLLMKLNSSGILVSARRIYNSNDKEFFYDVEADGGDLVITGDSKEIIGSAENSRMLALKYNKTTNSVTTAWILRTLEDTIFNQNIGYDIEKNGTSGYLVVGTTTPFASPSKGLLYKLDNNFQPIGQLHYTGNGAGQNGLYAADIFFDTNTFLSFAGFYTSNTPKLKGYVIRTDINGDSGCSDTLAPDTASITMSVSLLLDTLDQTYSAAKVSITRTALYDSLICSATRMAVQSGISSYQQELYYSLYPNPIQAGQLLKLDITGETKPVRIVVMNQLGKVVNNHKYEVSDNVSIPTSGYTPGFYVVKVIFDNNEDSRQENYKVIIK